MPGGNVLSKAGTTDSLVALHEEKIAASNDIGALEGKLRSEIFEKERANDKLKNQIITLQNQLAQCLPIAKKQEMENDRRQLELLLQATQHENEKMMVKLERAENRQRLLESELRKLAGENWQTFLNIPPPESPSLQSASAQPIGERAAMPGNPAFAASTVSLSASTRAPPVSGQRPTHKRTGSQSSILSRSVMGGGPSTSKAALHPPTPIREREGSPSNNPNSSFVTAPDRSRASPGEDNSGEDSFDEVDDVLDVSQLDDGAPTERELELERTNEMLRQQLEQVKLLVLGLDKRLSDREDALAKVVERAEAEGKGLESKLRELDLNRA
ncbi:hypothetical protein DL93DRAFT_2162155 [Clavulina sp. PMI_390]|nr:hypothetical protein DL93DRAFT_2162155 [Clavulina sp. PMI_390]